MSQLSLAEGSIFAGRYEVVRCIAAGGMGAVYEVLHTETQRRRALKVMLPHVVGNEELRGRFRQEARVAAHIESEFIVDVFDAGVDEATEMPFLVMELLRGEELGKRLIRSGKFTFKEVVTYLHQTAMALDKTHRASIVHRDLKPENLFLTEREDGQPRVKVLDFGIAKLVADAGTQENATRSLGTPLYMAPEQFRTTMGVSPQTDIYSLGMVAYTLLVGVPYWLDESRTETNVFAFAMVSVNGPPQPASVRARAQFVDLPPAFDVWFARATAVTPANRFTSAGEAVRALADALGQPLATVDTSGPHLPIVTATGHSGPLPESNTSSGATMTRPPAQKPAKALVVVAAASIALLGGGALAFFVTRGPPAGAGTTTTPSAEPVASVRPKETAATVTVAPSASAPAPVASASAPIAPIAPTAPVSPVVNTGNRPVQAKGTASAKPVTAPTAKIYSRD